MSRRAGGSGRAGAETSASPSPLGEGTQARPSRATAEKRNQQNKEDGLAFIGVRIPTSVHQRLYRAKAFLEYRTGKFYGMGKLIERALTTGLDIIEKEINPSTEQK